MSTCMDKPASREAKDHFKESLRRLEFPEEHFKLLECIARQAFMKVAGYKYSNDDIDNDLFGKMHPEDRQKKLSKYISEWEKRTGYEYGFELLHMNETEKLNKLIESYNATRNKLTELSHSLGLLADEIQTEAWLAKIQKALKAKLEVNQRGIGRFLIFNTDGEPVVKDLHHEYFKFYNAISFAVFEQYCLHLSEELNHKISVHKITSLRVQHQHQEIKNIGSLTSTEISERLNDNHNIKDKFLNLIQRKLCLIDRDFSVFLAKKAVKGYKFSA